MNQLILKEIPIRDKLNGLVIAYRVSKQWLKENPYIRPVAKHDLHKGQRVYELPKGISRKSIYFAHPLLASGK